MLQYLPQINSLEDTFWSDLPSSVGFGIGKVDSWTIDRSQDYVQRLELGLSAIRDCKPPIPDPLWEVEDGEAKISEQGAGCTMEYSGATRLRVRIPRKVSKVFLTSNGQDPREPDAQRVHVDGEWSEVVDRNTQIQMVSCTADSDYGRVLHIHFRNQNLRYHVQPKPQSRLGEREYYFTLASDWGGVKMTFESLIHETLESSGISRQQLAQLLRVLAEDLGD